MKSESFKSPDHLRQNLEDESAFRSRIGLGVEREQAYQQALTTGTREDALAAAVDGLSLNPAEMSYARGILENAPGPEDF
jgi:hypothetical protein